jgi:hypothetical protein
MTNERKELLSKVNGLIRKRKEALLNQLPSIHEIDDGIIIRFFTEWDDCDENNGVKYKKIQSIDKPNEIVVFFYLPKGAYFQLKKRNYIGNMTCLSGSLELDFDNHTRILNGYTKICLDSDTFEGRAIENTYVVTSNCQ